MGNGESSSRCGLVIRVAGDCRDVGKMLGRCNDLGELSGKRREVGGGGVLRLPECSRRRGKTPRVFRRLEYAS
jgi:hypothetical protein